MQFAVTPIGVVVANPAVSQTREAIAAAIIHYDETAFRLQHQLSLTGASDPAIITAHIRANTKLRALRFVLANIDYPPAIATACMHWRQIAREAARKPTETTIAAHIEANAYIMVYAWALGAFNTISRRKLP